MSLQTLIKRALDSPVDYSFIKRVVGRNRTLRMVSYNKTKPDETAVMLVLLHYLEDEETNIMAKKFKRLK